LLFAFAAGSARKRKVFCLCRKNEEDLDVVSFEGVAGVVSTNFKKTENGKQR
jgi:hypothetical protein